MSANSRSVSVYPISCVRCRRRKIKCNKIKPCNHCSHKGTPCEFPTTYRNKSFNDDVPEIIIKDEETSESSEGLELTSSSSSSVSKLEEELSFLRLKSSQMEKTLQELTRRKQILSSEEGDHDEKINAKGETSEKGEKYYGPLSSNNMVEEMQDISDNKLTRTESICHHSWTSNSHNQQPGTDSDSDTVDYSFHKKPLPWVLEKGASQQKNERALKLLVNNFFETRSYDYFVCRKNTLEFVDKHASMDNFGSEIDDELLVLYMILLISVARLTPSKYNEMGRSPVNGYVALWGETDVLKKVLFRGFSQLRHNLLNESHVTVQAYILCTEWEFLEGRYEESWSMMFHSCSVAYALGLHVILKPNKFSRETPSHLHTSHPAGDFETFEQYKDDYFQNKLPKVRVWFALRYLSAQMCSILGRPNPILLQTNPVSLPTVKATKESEVKEQNKMINALLKSGLSECLRLSNLNLIESFMHEISIENVSKIEDKYREELSALTYYLSPQYQAQINAGFTHIDELTQMPNSINRSDARDDLLVLHVNRIKYLEPLLDMPQDTRTLLASISESIVSFVEHLSELMHMFTKEIMQSTMPADANMRPISLQKMFIFKDPLLASYVYQGIVVIFILLHTRANELIQFNGEDYITQLERKFQGLMSLQYSVAEMGNFHLWSSKQWVLMQKIVEHTAVIRNHFRNERQSNQTAFQGFENDPQISDLLGNNLKDAFWVENPENSPYYLGMSRDDSSTNNTPNMMNAPVEGPFGGIESFQTNPQGAYSSEMMGQQPGMMCEYEPLQNNMNLDPKYQ